MSISFIHLSDIHLYQESELEDDIDGDLRNAILIDMQMNAVNNISDFNGILVGGDIAATGSREEYDVAKCFFKEMTNQLGIREVDVYCVPGNHDVDQSVVKTSKSLLTAQKEIELAENIDLMEGIIKSYMEDGVNPNILYKSLEEYNEFSARYDCDIHSKKSTWKVSFDLGNHLKLDLIGMNTCLISSHQDHANKSIERKMIVSQRQIPRHEDNAVRVLLAHHPIECWKFNEIMIGRMDSRIDIQLYGHKHTQVIMQDENKLVINAGAVQPERKNCWEPRYNWITFECKMYNSDRVVSVKVYPRVLSENRDRFVADREQCDVGEIFFTYELNIDKKRERFLMDNPSRWSLDSMGMDKVSNLEENEDLLDERNFEIVRGIQKQIIYHFFGLSEIKQKEILINLGLYKESYSKTKYIYIIKDILQDAIEKDVLNQMFEMATMKGGN